MSLHQQISAELDRLDRWRTVRTVKAIAAALELHAPVPCKYGNCTNAAHRVCKACGPGVTADDCETVRAIARELGIEEGDRGQG